MGLEAPTGPHESERRSQRRYAAGGLDGSLPDGQPIDVLDLSPGGLAVATAERLAVDRNYEIRLGYRGKQIGIPCRVAWCTGTRDDGRSDAAQQGFVAGLALRRQMSKETKELLETFQQIAVTTLPAKIHGRARFLAKSEPEQPRWSNIVVRRISQKGLYCEIGVEPLPFKAFDIEVPLGETTFATRARLSVPAEKDPDVPGLYRAGLEFLEPTGPARKILADYMAAQLAAIRPSATAHRTD